MSAEKTTRGDYTVPTGKGMTGGEPLKHGLDGLCLFMVLPQHHGWKPLDWYRYSHDGTDEPSHGKKGALLSHQTYRKHVENYLAENPGTREVAVVDLDNGEWKTVWTRHNHEPAADERSGGDA